MTDAELLQYYIQCNRIIHGALSGILHRREVLNRTSRRVGPRTRLGPSLACVHGGQ